MLHYTYMQYTYVYVFVYMLHTYMHSTQNSAWHKGGDHYSMNTFFALLYVNIFLYKERRAWETVYGLRHTYYICLSLSWSLTLLDPWVSATTVLDLTHQLLISSVWPKQHRAQPAQHPCSHIEPLAWLAENNQEGPPTLLWSFHLTKRQRG